MYVILPTYTTISILYYQLFRVISRYSWLFMVIHVIKPTASLQYRHIMIRDLSCLNMKVETAVQTNQTMTPFRPI